MFRRCFLLNFSVSFFFNEHLFLVSFKQVIYDDGKCVKRKIIRYVQEFPLEGQALEDRSFVLQTIKRTLFVHNARYSTRLFVFK